MLESGGRGLGLHVGRQRNSWRPPTDVYETNETVIVRIEIAGMDEDQIDIELERRQLIVRGFRRDHGSETIVAVQQMEIYYGEFLSETYLPWPVDEGKIMATYRDGFLVITLPKARPFRVPITCPETADEHKGNE